MLTHLLPKTLPSLALGIFLLLLSWALPGTVVAQGLQIVTTTSTLGMLAREIGGDTVQVRVLAPPDRDPHYLDARPSFMAALRRADLLVEMGADLEEGWLPVVQTSAGNPRILTGREGHFKASSHLQLRRSITMDGPNLGHLHAEGNPHFQVDPLRIAAVAMPLAAHMGTLDPQQESAFMARAEQIAMRIRSHAAELREQVSVGRLLMTYHEDLDYLEEWLPVALVGHLEPLPGIPPSARHLRTLVTELAELRPGVVIHAEYQPARGARFLQQELGWEAKSVRMEPPADARLEDYLDLMQHWVDALK